MDSEYIIFVIDTSGSMQSVAWPQVVRKVSEDKDYLVDNPNRRCPIIDKARDALEYHPEIDLEEGLRRALLWYADNREAEDS